MNPPFKQRLQNLPSWYRWMRTEMGVVWWRIWLRIPAYFLRAPIEAKELTAVCPLCKKRYFPGRV